MNWFNHQSGKKLTSNQEWIIKNIERPLTYTGIFLKHLGIPLVIIGFVAYIVLHFIIKYW